MASQNQFRFPLAAAGVFFLTTGALFGQAEFRPHSPGCAGVLFTVDGSGSLRSTSKDLAKAICCSGLPIEVHPFEWSHGIGHVLTDLCNRSYHAKKGCELAQCVMAFREANPHRAIGLIGHSSGAAIVLAATEFLPPGSVDRIILLAPAVSPGYDLRPALRASLCGIDTFYSRGDLVSRWLLLTGTADGRHRVAAGCTPFEEPDACCPDTDLYHNLRQHSYGQDGAGGHFGCTRFAFFRTRVIPLLRVDRP